MEYRVNRTDLPKIPFPEENQTNASLIRNSCTFIKSVLINRETFIRYFNKSRFFKTLRWLGIVSWRARPGPLNTATESRLMHTTTKLKVVLQWPKSLFGN